MKITGENELPYNRIRNLYTFFSVSLLSISNSISPYMCGTVAFRFVPCCAVPFHRHTHIFQSYRFFTVFCLDSESICEFRLRKQTLATTMTSHRGREMLKTLTMPLYGSVAHLKRKRRTVANRTNVQFPCAPLKICYFVFCASLLPALKSLTHIRSHPSGIFFRFGIFFLLLLLPICRHSVVRWKIRNILSNHVLSSSFLFHSVSHRCIRSLYTCISKMWFLFFFRWFGGVSSCISSRPRR